MDWIIAWAILFGVIWGLAWLVIAMFRALTRTLVVGSQVHRNATAATTYLNSHGIIR